MRVLCPQTDFEKDVDMACRSGKLQAECFSSVCVSSSGAGRCCSPEGWLCFMGGFGFGINLLVVPLPISLTSACQKSVRQEMPLECCIIEFCPCWQERDKHVLSGYRRQKWPPEPVTYCCHLMKSLLTAVRQALGCIWNLMGLQIILAPKTERRQKTFKTQDTKWRSDRKKCFI